MKNLEDPKKVNAFFVWLASFQRRQEAAHGLPAKPAKAVPTEKPVVLFCRLPPVTNVQRVLCKVMQEKHIAGDVKEERRVDT